MKTAILTKIRHEDRVRAFWFLASLCFVAFGFYVYAVSATAHNVAMRAELEREASNISAELATLEFQYIKLQNEVTLSRALELGFTEVETPLYATRGDYHSFSFNTR